MQRGRPSVPPLRTLRGPDEIPWHTVEVLKDRNRPVALKPWGFPKMYAVLEHARVLNVEVICAQEEPDITASLASDNVTVSRCHGEHQPGSAFHRSDRDSSPATLKSVVLAEGKAEAIDEERDRFIQVANEKGGAIETDHAASVASCRFEIVS